MFVEDVFESRIGLQAGSRSYRGLGMGMMDSSRLDRAGVSSKMPRMN